MNLEKHITNYLNSDDYRWRKEQIENMLIVGQFSQEFKDWLYHTDFLLAPASMKHHSNYLGGLAQHTINVYKIITNVSDKTAATLALCHDLCKVNLYQPYISKGFRNWTLEEMEDRMEIEEMYKLNRFNDIHETHIHKYRLTWDNIHEFLYGKQRGKIPALRTTYDFIGINFKINEELNLNHGCKSIYIAMKHGANLSYAEAVAIQWHMEMDDRNWVLYRPGVHKNYYSIVKTLQRADQDATQTELMEADIDEESNIKE